MQCYGRAAADHPDCAGQQCCWLAQLPLLLLPPSKESFIIAFDPKILAVS
jgi:hypothetical protein